jgi:hypothetical protein
LGEDEIAGKLRVIPVFCVTDREGRPLLTEVSSSAVTSLGSTNSSKSARKDAFGGALGLLDATEQHKALDTRSDAASDRRVGYFYLDYRDAASFLHQLQDEYDEDGTTDLARDAHIVAIPLDEALNFVSPTEGGRGRVPDPTDEFHLVPSEQSVRFAARVLRANGALGASARIRGVPLFSIRGFALQRVVEDSTTTQAEATSVSAATATSKTPSLLTPMFFTPDDVQFAWDRLRQISNEQGSTLTSNVPLDRVQVTDLRTVLQGMRQGSGSFQPADATVDYRSLVFLPSRMSAAETDPQATQAAERTGTQVSHSSDGGENEKTSREAQ